MSDLIDRQALKNKLKRWDEIDPYEFVEMVYYAIDSAPAIDAAPRWVRCEERLPENKKHYYLVCTDMGYMCSCRWTNNVYGFRESDEWGWSMIDVPQYQKVTHWMPIEPPKEDE